MSFFTNLITNLAEISRSNDEHNKKLSQILERQEEKLGTLLKYTD